MFLGQAVHSLDDKNRLAIPARFRQHLAEGMYLTKGVDRCVYILTPEGWDRLTERIMALPSMQPEGRRLQRHFFAGADHVTPDKLGRIIVPANLREYAQLRGEIVVAGVQTRIELWDRATWDAEQARADEETAEMAAQIATMSDQLGSLGV